MPGCGWVSRQSVLGGFIAIMTILYSLGVISMYLLGRLIDTDIADKRLAWG
jgi:hypothetical protein